MTKQIPLTQDKFTVVDDDVYQWASKHKWCAHRDRGVFYAIRKERGNIVRLHREIMKASDGVHVDHISGDGLDNRRGNLRLCTHAENQRNRGSQSNNTSGFKGVSWNKSSGKWMAKIKVDGKAVHLGYFASKEDAARAYDTAATKYHGEFAKTNF